MTSFNYIIMIFIIIYLNILSVIKQKIISDGPPHLMDEIVLQQMALYYTIPGLLMSLNINYNMVTNIQVKMYYIWHIHDFVNNNSF